MQSPVNAGDTAKALRLVRVPIVSSTGSASTGSSAADAGFTVRVMSIHIAMRHNSFSTPPNISSSSSYVPISTSVLKSSCSLSYPSSCDTAQPEIIETHSSDRTEY